MSGQNDASKSTATIKFDPQTYLMTYFKDLQPIISSNTSFDYVIPLDTSADYSLPVTLAKLTDRTNSNKFTKLKAYQYNSIVPRIRLYRVEYDDQKNISSQKEFIFNKDYKYSATDMTNPVVRDNSGIKSISWTLAGTNPVAAQKQIMADIEFYFDSINAFSGGSYDLMYEAWTSSDNNYQSSNFNFCDTEVKNDGKPSTGTTRNYWSLLFHPQTPKEKYDTFNFRIKAIVGWEDLDPNIISNLNLDGVNEDIQKLTYCFFLNLIKHDFIFNEDGSLILKCYYNASFENETNNYNFNLLGNLKSQVEALKDKRISDLRVERGTVVNAQATPGQALLNEKLNDALSEIGYTGFKEGNFNINRLSNVTDLTYNQIVAGQKLLNTLSNTEQSLINKCIENPSLTNIEQGRMLLTNIENPVVGKILNLSEISKEQTAANYQKIVDIVQQQLDAKIVQTKGEFYSKFIKNLLDVSKNPNKFFKLPINSNIINQWEKWINNENDKKPSFIGLGSGSANVSIDTSYLSDTIDRTARGQPPSNEQLEEQKKKLFESALAKTTDENSSIVFTTLGHVFDAAFKTIKDNLGENNPLQERLKQNKIILTNISGKQKVFQLGTEDASNVSYDFPNMAFIPIEVSLLQAFYIDRVVKPQKDTYPLFAFVRDMLSTLIGSALNASNQYNQEAQAYSDVSLASTIITLGNNGENADPIFINNILLSSDFFLAPNFLEPYYVNFVNMQNHTAFYNYFFVYDKNYNDFLPTNNIIEDESKGVYWYTYGQDYGLIKDIKFTKIDQPYGKEAKATGTQTFFLGQFRDRYNADITMIGNNIYYPGMMLHITPSVEVAGSTSGNVSFAQLTGIGGYYCVIEVSSKITEEGYETTLKTIWQFDGSEKRTSDKNECTTLLQSAGLIQGDNSDLSAEVLNLIANLAEAERKKVEAAQQEQQRQEFLLDDGSVPSTF